MAHSPIFSIPIWENIFLFPLDIPHTNFKRHSIFLILGTLWLFQNNVKLFVCILWWFTWGNIKNPTTEASYRHFVPALTDESDRVVWASVEWWPTGMHYSTHTSALSTVRLTWTVLRLNPGFQSEKQGIK